MDVLPGVVILGAFLSAIHLLTLAVGLGGLFIRGQALSQTLDEAGWNKLLAADNAWGLSALLWITSGLARVFFGGKEPSFYWYNGFFWVKLALFGAVFALELAPMITFLRVRSARRRREPLPQFSIDTYRRINAAELALIVAIVLAAAFMARGVWLF